MRGYNRRIAIDYWSRLYSERGQAFDLNGIRALCAGFAFHENEDNSLCFRLVPFIW